MSRLFFFVLVIAAVVVGVGCSSDPDTPLGTQFITDSLITTDPGDVIEDTIRVALGDTTFLVNSVITQTTTMTVGRSDNFETTILVRPDFSTAGSDTARTVSRAELTFRSTTTDTTVVTAQFFELLEAFSEGDTMTSLNLAATAIPDTLGNTLRTMKQFALITFDLPPALVQDWIRGNTPNNGIAVVLDDTTTTKQVTYGTRENVSYRPYLTVFYADQTQTGFFMSADGYFVNDLAVSSNLLLSDGTVQRVFVPVDLSSFNADVLLNDALLILNVVPGSYSGGDPFVGVYVPDCVDPSDPCVLSGKTVGERTLTGSLRTNFAINTATNQLVVRVLEAVQAFLNENDGNDAFVIKYSFEETDPRRMEFYDHNAASVLVPQLLITLTNTPTFPRP